MKLVASSVLVIALSAGCALDGDVVIDEPRDRDRPDDEYPIPAGHMPPPGECRVWYPDREPGQQPPPGKCENLRYQVPRGAWLIRG
jgi:hypothetical protein